MKQTSTAAPVRESGYELLRILSMLMIVSFHTLRYVDTSGFTPCQMLLWHGTRWYGLFGVNCFLMISAWYLLERTPKMARLAPLIWQTAFYCITLYLFFLLSQVVSGRFDPIKDIVNLELDALLSPLWSNRYWFITAYVFLYIMTPFLNRLIRSLSPEGYRTALISVGVFLFLYLSFPQDTGSTTVVGDCIWCAYVYFLTGYLKLHADTRFLERHAGVLLFVTYAVFVISKQLLTYVIRDSHLRYVIEHTTGSGLRYSFWMLLLAVELFYLFRRLHFQSVIVNRIASCMLGVYLFHENHVFHVCERALYAFWFPFLNHIPSLGLYLTVLILGQMIVGILFDLFRQSLPPFRSKPERLPQTP